ncbi:hypothetical protein RRG08_020885 [Elysia crispata]|uniref:Uncharacterized protein n=1 Tax=Elysia crispata TaxID=231223 RepID=A0AAE1D8L9_9GAST|nr:hypothetical protein RRG08_020885 [Elysia crispata]
MVGFDWREFSRATSRNRNRQAASLELHINIKTILGDVKVGKQASQTLPSCVDHRYLKPCPSHQAKLGKVRTTTHCSRTKRNLERCAPPLTAGPRTAAGEAIQERQQRTVVGSGLGSLAEVHCELCLGRTQEASIIKDGRGGEGKTPL